MDLFFSVRKERMTLYLDAREDTKVIELKRMIDGICGKPVEEQRLMKIDTKEVLEDDKTLGDCGFTSQNAKAQEPAEIGLVFKINDTDYENLSITPYSIPPDLPDVMKPTDRATTA
ncbi:elongin-B-like [Dysidea avara]|uniref:elongin-B-like n=1 Tax=Dysidea avara TaxID=196820 RepID=UPI0033275DDA